MGLDGARLGAGELEQAKFFLGDPQRLCADAGPFGRFFRFGGVGGAILEVVLVQITFDDAVGEADHGVDEAGEFVGIGEEAVAKLGGVSFGEEFAEVGRDDLQGGAAGGGRGNARCISDWRTEIGERRTELGARCWELGDRWEARETRQQVYGY